MRLCTIWAPQTPRGARGSSWTLVARHALNPGSAALKAYHLQFEPTAEARPEWEAGDIVEAQPCNPPEAVEAVMSAQTGEGELLDVPTALRKHLAGAMLPEPGEPIDAEAMRALRPLPIREYSAASIASDGTLDLVIRQVRHDDGQLGIGSGWLIAHLPVGTTTLLRFRPNPGFRLTAEQPNWPLILIGNGTVIAGLRAHLRAQAHGGHKSHWLVTVFASPPIEC